MADLPDWLLALLGSQQQPSGPAAFPAQPPAGLLAGALPPQIGGLLARPVPVGGDPNSVKGQNWRDYADEQGVSPGSYYSPNWQDAPSTPYQYHDTPSYPGFPGSPATTDQKYWLQNPPTLNPNTGSPATPALITGRSVALAPERPVPVDAGMDNASDPNTPIRQAASYASDGLTQGRSADSGTSGTSVVGTPASGQTEASSPGFFSKAGQVLGGLYGQGGPGDSLIQLGAGIASPEGWAKGVTQTSQNMNSGALNQARLQAFKLQLAQQQAGQTATASYLRGKGASDAEISAAINGAAAGQTGLLNNLIQQYSGPDKNRIVPINGGLVGVDTQDLSKAPVQIVAPQATTRPLTDPTERAAHGIPAEDNGPYSIDVAGKVAPIAASSDPGLKAAEALQGQIAQNFQKSKEGAIAAVRTREAVARQRQALDNGAITGSGAEGLTNARAFLGQVLGIGDPRVIASQEFDTAAKQKGAELAKALSNSGHTTNADLLLGQAIAGGDRSKYEQAIRSAIEAQDKLASETVDRHNSDIKKFKGVVPEAAGKVADFYRIEQPDFSQQKPQATTQADPLAGARDAIAKGAPRQAVINRLLQNGINPAGL